MFDLATVHGEHYKVLTPGIIVRDLWQGVQQAIVFCQTLFYLNRVLSF